MLRLGIIGTSWISHEFIRAAHLSGQYQLGAVYSRTLSSAEAFVSSYDQIALYTDMMAFLESDLDVVYIASPNALHFSQARLAILAHKHVIIEKPAVARPEEWLELVKLAQNHQVYLFEAARNIHETAYASVKEFLQGKTILGAHLTYAKYSSKMPDLLAGKIPNIFSEEFAGGALMDLGVYLLYFAIGLFGASQDSHYLPQQLPNTIDLNGIGSLIYPDFHVHLQTGKNITSNLQAEIYTADGTLYLNGVERLSQGRFLYHTGEEEPLHFTPAPHQMLEEVTAFAHAISGHTDPAYQEWLKTATIVHQTLYQMRRRAGIYFKDDLDEK